jgi:hypothetical protein
MYWKELRSNGTVRLDSFGTDLVIVLEWLSNDLVT